MLDLVVNDARQAFMALLGRHLRGDPDEYYMFILTAKMYSGRINN